MAKFRNGQWVKLIRDVSYIGTLDGQAFTLTLPAGLVGIHHIPSIPKKLADGRVVMGPGTKGEFHKLDQTGLVTVRQYRIPEDIPEDAFIAVTSRDDLPAGRLATMSPDFVPTE